MSPIAGALLNRRGRRGAAAESRREATHGAERRLRPGLVGGGLGVATGSRPDPTRPVARRRATTPRLRPRRDASPSRTPPRTAPARSTAGAATAGYPPPPAATVPRRRLRAADRTNLGTARPHGLRHRPRRSLDPGAPDDAYRGHRSRCPTAVAPAGWIDQSAAGPGSPPVVSHGHRGRPILVRRHGLESHVRRSEVHGSERARPRPVPPRPGDRPVDTAGPVHRLHPAERHRRPADAGAASRRSRRQPRPPRTPASSSPGGPGSTGVGFHHRRLARRQGRRCHRAHRPTGRPARSADRPPRRCHDGAAPPAALSGDAAAPRASTPCRPAAPSRAAATVLGCADGRRRRSPARRRRPPPTPSAPAGPAAATLAGASRSSPCWPRCGRRRTAPTRSPSASNPTASATVKATVTVNADQIVVQLTADNDQARDVLRQALPLLRHELGGDGSSATVVHLERAYGQAHDHRAGPRQRRPPPAPTRPKTTTTRPPSRAAVGSTATGHIDLHL